MRGRKQLQLYNKVLFILSLEPMKQMDRGKADRGELEDNLSSWYHVN